MNCHLSMRLVNTLCLTIFIVGLYGCGKDLSSVSSNDNTDIVDTGGIANGDNTSNGNEGDETTSGNEGDETSSGNEGDETTSGNEGDETSNGTEGNETASGNEGDETTTFVNLALHQQATQSSIAFTGEATRAVDGNTDGAFRNNSVTHTDSETNAWWQLDLSAIQFVNHIIIYNRTDNCCTARLSDFYVLISETPFASQDLALSLQQSNITSFHINSEVDVSVSIDIDMNARYIRIQQNDSGNPISLAEVQVMTPGETVETPDNELPTDSTSPDDPTDPNEADDSTDQETPIDPDQPTEEELAAAQALIDYASGEAIYDAKCSSCHLTLANSSKRDRTEAQIRQAVAIIPSMKNIALTDTEYALLELVLNNEPPIDTIVEDESNSDALPANPTLLGRITNEEFVNSAMSLLAIQSTESIESAKTIMGAESDVLGLLNDASTQLLNQVAISGYINMIDVLIDVYFEETNTLEDMNDLYACDANLLDCGKLVTHQIAKKAFRRELTEQEETQINSLFDSVTESYAEVDLEDDQFNIVSHQIRFRSAMYYILLSPDFLFLIETGSEEIDSNGELLLSSQEIATRMAFFLTGNLPDDALLAAIEDNTLQDPIIRAEHTDRLLNSESGEQQIANVLRAWLSIKDDLDDSSSDTLNAFLLDWVTNEKPFSDLYQTPINVEHIDGTTSVQPLGILGLKGFVSSHTEFPSPSFINRGLFVVERLLCETLPDDIPAAALEAGELTEVEAFEVHSQDDCASCHRVFDNYGAAFQQFEPETSLFDVNNIIFGTSFDLYDIGDVVNEVSDVSDLSSELATSETASACMAELWYRDALRRNVGDKDTQALTYLINQWQSSEVMSIKSLLKAIVVSDVFITLYL